MPRICEFYGIVISMNWREHLPPNFHATYGEFKAGIAIGSDEVLVGELPPRALRLVRRWAGLHEAELWDDWRRASAQSPLRGIDPLP